MIYDRLYSDRFKPILGEKRWDGEGVERRFIGIIDPCGAVDGFVEGLIEWVQK